jgi:phosphoenolpyruvate carboxylase
MERLADQARRAYRAVVYEDPRFVPYFRAATPEPELALMNIGSRPARRVAGTAGVETLRAIPWQFGWIQTRLMLASWLGIEEALTGVDRDLLRDMYARWPFFRSTVDLIEIALATADGVIAAQYDVLVPAELRPVGHELRARLARAIHAVLTVTGHRELLETNPVLRRSIAVRNPYVDPINLMQVELLRRLRRPSASADPRLRDAFGVTVTGIAAGMRNTG